MVTLKQDIIQIKLYLILNSLPQHFFFEESGFTLYWKTWMYDHWRTFHLTVGGDNKYKMYHEQFLKGTQIIQSNCTYKDMSPQWKTLRLSLLL